MTMIRGLVDLVTGARTVSGLPSSFLRFGDADYFSIPSQFIVWMALAVVLTVVLTKTRFGRNIYNNRQWRKSFGCRCVQSPDRYRGADRNRGLDRQTAQREINGIIDWSGSLTNR